MTRIDKCLLACALLALLAGGALRSTVRAEAQSFGPQVTGGTNPWLDFSGSAPSGTPTVVYTVPADRVFIMTGMWLPSVDHGGAQVLEGSQPKVLLGSRAALNGPLNRGNSHVVFTAGSTLEVEGASSYFIQGYLAHP